MSKDISDSKVIKMCEQIRQAMTLKKVSYQRLFGQADTETVGMINLGQFAKSLNTIITIAAPIVEKLFNIMDTNGIGMIDMQRF